MLKKIWNNLEENILVGSYLVIIPILFLQVVMRYVFNRPLSWSEELARYIFIWQIWLGSSYCVQRFRHIRIDMFTEKLSPNARLVFEVFITAVCIAFCCFLVYKGYATMSLVARLHQTSPAMKIPMQVIYSCVPISSALMVIRYIEVLIKTIRGGNAAVKS